METLLPRSLLTCANVLLPAPCQPLVQVCSQTVSADHVVPRVSVRICLCGHMTGGSANQQLDLWSLRLTLPVVALQLILIQLLTAEGGCAGA